MLLSDFSQSSAAAGTPFPEDMTEVLLEEVVRCSERIVTGAMSFQIGGE